MSAADSVATVRSPSSMDATVVSQGTGPIALRFEVYTGAPCNCVAASRNQREGNWPRCDPGLP